MKKAKVHKKFKKLIIGKRKLKLLILRRREQQILKKKTELKRKLGIKTSENQNFQN